MNGTEGIPAAHRGEDVKCMTTDLGAARHTGMEDS